MAVIAVEPTVYGIKAAKQIANLLDHYKVPYIYVINKIKSDTDTVLVEKELGQKAVAYIPFGESIDDEHMERIFDHGLSHIKEKGDNRYSQSTVKFTFNKEYNS
jgi:MinD superfamily P-loop ATPase